MPFQKGQPRPKNAGRKKGSVNRTPAEIKQAFVEAFYLAGGVPALVKWAKKNRTVFYRSVVSIVPKEIDASVSGRVTVELVEEIIDPPDRSESGEAPPGASRIPTVNGAV